MCKIFAVEYIHTLGLHQRLCSSLLSQFQKSYQLNQQNWLGCLPQHQHQENTANVHQRMSSAMSITIGDYSPNMQHLPAKQILKHGAAQKNWGV